VALSKVWRDWPLPRIPAERIVLINATTNLWLAEVMGIAGIPMPYGAANASPHFERFKRTLREERSTASSSSTRSLSCACAGCTWSSGRRHLRRAEGSLR